MQTPLSLTEESPAIGDSSVRRAFEWLALSHVRAVAALVFLSLAAFLPGIASIPPLDRDEARFVAATKQMLETGNFVDIRLGEEPRYQKPVGIYWLQAAAVTAAGYGSDAPIWAYRLAPLAGGIAVVLLTYWTALPMFSRKAALIAAVLMALSVELAFEARVAKTDAVLAATILLSMGALARLYLRREDNPPSLWLPIAFWAGMGLGILVKGPIAPMVAGLAIAVLMAADRQIVLLKRLRPLIGVPLAAAVVLPWLVAIVLISGGEFLNRSVGSDLLGKVASGGEGHGAPPGTHLAWFVLMFSPGTILAALAAPWVWRHRGDTAVRFCLAWIVPSWLVFELVVTKLPNYTLPLYPAIAALTAAAVLDGWRTLSPRLVRFFPTLPMAATAATGLLAAWFVWNYGQPSAELLAVAAVVAALAAAAILAGLRLSIALSAVLAVAAAVVWHAAIFGLAIPSVPDLQVSRRVIEAAVRDAPCSDPAIFAAGYVEASLLFYGGSGVGLGDGGEAAGFLDGPGCRVALVEEQAAEAFRAGADELKLELALHDTVSGFNIAKGRGVSVAIYTADRKPL